MANEYLTLFDLKNRMEPGDGAIASVAEIIAQDNAILSDIPWARGNLVTGDVHFKRVVQPRAQVRKINEGLEATSSKTEAVTDTCIELAARGAVDMRELDLAPNAAEYLLTENRPHIASLGEELCNSFFYGSDAAGILGFAPRMGKLTNDQVVDSGGTGNNLSSVYIIKWDTTEVTGIYPKNSQAGLKTIAQSNVYMPDRDGKTFLAHVTDYSWFAGLKVRDPRYAARLCNLDVDALATDAEARQKLFRDLIWTKNKVHKVEQGRVVMYVSPDVFTILEIAAFEKGNALLGYKEDIKADTRLLTFSGIPIKRNDCQKPAEKKVA